MPAHQREMCLIFLKAIRTIDVILSVKLTFLDITNCFSLLANDVEGYQIIAKNFAENTESPFLDTI